MSFTHDEIKNIEIIVEGIEKVIQVISQQLELFVYDRSTKTHRLREGKIIRNICRDVYIASTLYLTVSNPPSNLIENILRKIYWDKPQIAKDLEEKYYRFINDVSKLSTIKDPDKLYDEMFNLQYNLKSLASTLETGAEIAKAGTKQPAEEPAEPEQKDEGSKTMITVRTSKENWEAIRSEYDISKKDFGKKINFVSDLFKRKIIFRDVEHAFVLASQGFSKPALILAGGVIEELLRQYLERKNIKPKNKRFVDYITACEDNGLLKRGVSRLSDSVRNFRNLVHLENEKTRRDTVLKATAKGTVSSIFTIANDFQ